MVKNLKLLRNGMGMSQKQLADIIHVSQQSVNKYENHEVEPNIDTLIALADYFNTSVDYLIGVTDIDRKIENVTRFDLNGDEQLIIERYRKLGADDKKIIKAMFERLSK